MPGCGAQQGCYRPALWFGGLAPGATAAAVDVTTSVLFFVFLTLQCSFRGFTTPELALSDTSGAAPLAPYNIEAALNPGALYYRPPVFGLRLCVGRSRLFCQISLKRGV